MKPLFVLIATLALAIWAWVPQDVTPVIKGSDAARHSNLDSQDRSFPR
jgi:hypothetical protein